jgi:FkbM family methyltransferase
MNVTHQVKHVIQTGLRQVGYELRRVPSAPTARDPATPPPDWPWGWIRATRSIGTIIDIGANDGRFADFLARYFKPASVYVFEPLRSCLPALEALAADLPNVRVFNLALSDRSGTAPLYENSYPPSTSLYRVGETMRREFPFAAGETATVVDLARLDDVVDPALLDRDIFLKVDVQGAEAEVIRGGREVFGASACVLIEMTFISMYHGQPLFEEVHDLLHGLGLRLAGVRNQICSTRSGEPLFAHCLYVRDDRRPRPAVEEAGAP